MVSGRSPPSVTGYPILLYLDDWLICIPTLNHVVMDTEKVLAQIKSLVGLPLTTIFISINLSTNLSINLTD